MLCRGRPYEKWYFRKGTLGRKFVFIEHLLSYQKVYIQAYRLTYIFYLYNPYKKAVWQLLLFLFYRWNRLRLKSHHHKSLTSLVKICSPPQSQGLAALLSTQDNLEIRGISQDLREAQNSEVIIRQNEIIMMTNITMTKNKPSFAIFPAGSVESGSALGLKWPLHLKQKSSQAPSFS